MCGGVTQSYAGLIVCRLLVGICETGVYPGAIYLVATYYPGHALYSRMSFFLTSRLIANAFGGVSLHSPLSQTVADVEQLLGFAIAHMEGVAGYAAWRWIFIVEGAFTAVFALVCVFLVPGWPQEAGFLRDEDQKLLVRSLDREADGTSESPNSWTLFKEVGRDPKVYLR